MSISRRVTAALVQPDNPKSLSAMARRRRWARFRESFPDITGMRVLDLGGTPSYWHTAPQQPLAVTVVNLAAFHSGRDEITTIQGDACAPPAAVTGERYDLVVSNSLIEHVGGHAQRMRLAQVIHDAADRHWVQTPYRYFPVEPHWLCPGLQFLPFSARVQVTLRWPLGHQQTSEPVEACAFVHEVELLGRCQMRSYFPESALWMESMAGLPKSMVAIRA